MALRLQNVESLKAIAMIKIKAKVLHTQSKLAMIFQHQLHISAIISPITNLSLENNKGA